jgi:hypothetical protein
MLHAVRADQLVIDPIIVVLLYGSGAVAAHREALLPAVLPPLMLPPQAVVIFQGIVLLQIDS